MVFSLKTVGRPLIFGFVLPVILMFFELRYLFSDADFNQKIQPRVFLLLVSQVVFFALAFLVATLTLKYAKKDFLKGNLLDSIGLVLLFFNFLSFLIAIRDIPYLTYLNLLVSIILSIIGVISYRRTKNELAVTFILWGIVVFVLSLLFTSVGYWS